MAEADWKEILSFSQRELKQADKDKLCENLSWMEADDIELNFSDLKALFRLAQDILKYKSDQVNNLNGSIEVLQRKINRARSKGQYADSPTKGSDSVLETINHQEEVIKSNKEILEQLYADIAELEGKKSKLESERDNLDKDSESSRDALSELNELVQLENEVVLKNKHIRKLLSDVKILEDENRKLKEKVTILKDKLNEATALIENLTEQLYAMNNETSQLKDAFGKSEEIKSQLSLELETLRKELSIKDINRDSMYDEIKSKVQHWKNIAKSKKAEIETLANENTKLKENLIRASQPTSSPKQKYVDENKIKELQVKLAEASREIEHSADIIEKLKVENRRLKTVSEESVECQVTDIKNESDDSKEKIIINKLKRKVKTLTIALHEAEEMITLRDTELADVASQLQLVQSDDGIKSLLDGLKNKKRQLKTREEGIKSLVEDINNLNQLVDDLQLENESLRSKYNVPRSEIIPTKGILKRLYDAEENYKKLDKMLKKAESKLITCELDNHNMKNKCNKMTNLLIDLGCDENTINQIDEISDTLENEPANEKESKEKSPIEPKTAKVKKSCGCESEMQAIADENEGLRKGLQELLNFLKNNSTTSSGILTLECPSLDAVLQSMEARHAAGWFAPHMSTVMELRAALGGKDALLKALHEARRETFDLMTQLSKETQKSSDLEKKLLDIEKQQKSEAESLNDDDVSKTNNLQRISSVGEIGSWMSLEEDKIECYTQNEIENHVTKRNSSYEDYLKKGLNYFYEKFRALFEKMTSIEVQTADQQNHWSIQEEQYKAQIESLKAQIKQEEDEDISEHSPGLIFIPSTATLERKCSFLEESYKYIRTVNENMKNEILENKKEAMLITFEYETQVQRLMLVIANLFDKLRNSISIDSFWKQNIAFNETLTKYRSLVEDYRKREDNNDLAQMLEQNKSEMLDTIRNNLQKGALDDDDRIKRLLSATEQLIGEKHINKFTAELETKNDKIKLLEAKYNELQGIQIKIIDDTLAADTKEEVDLLKSQLEKVAADNKLLKEQCQHIGSQLDIALLQLQDGQQRQFSNDIEINMLRHQILDLQSAGDNKAIIARLGGEVLVAHLQASESHKKIERLNAALNREKQSRMEAEEMLKARQKIFDIYAKRYESKFSYMYEVMQILRQQYHGSLPLASLENYLNKLEELTRKTYAANEKLEDIEDLQYKLMTKHSIYEQVLDLTKNKCFEEQDGCAHKLKVMVLEGMHSREESYYSKKLKAVEKSREDLLNYCNKLENTLVLLNQGFEKPPLDFASKRNGHNKDQQQLELEDVQSDDESQSRRSRTITLTKPQILKPELEKPTADINKAKTEKAPTATKNGKPEILHVSVQTESFLTLQRVKSIQTDADEENTVLKNQFKTLETEYEKMQKDLTDIKISATEKLQDAINLNAQNIKLAAEIEKLKELNHEKDKLYESIHDTIEELKHQNDELKAFQITQRNKLRDVANEENKSLVLALKEVEYDKNNVVAEYKKLLQNERDDYAKSMKDLNLKLLELQSKLDSKESDAKASKADTIKEVISKYTSKIADLEDTCFKTQSELDACRTDLITYQSELDRWKDLAIERLAKMEQLNAQLKERHCHEVNSYKAENQHWLSQLNETQREHLELRTRLSEQKAMYVKQLADKDAIIEQLRSSVHNLKTQIISMQTMISVNDPSFDLSAIVEVDEASDGLSQHGSERLELKFDSAVDIHEMQDELMRMPASSTTIWQEPVIERLRREKQLASKQNAILRRQIKALAARERRARLDAQNLKNQVFRISTSGGRVATAETASLQSKIASLQAQLLSARRDNNSSVALWDKWKRAQQSSDRWQARYEDKCQEVKKLEANLHLAKSALERLEREKRVLLARLTEVKQAIYLTEEKQDAEVQEKSSRLSETDRSHSPPPISERALLDRVQAQQRRIAALEVAEKGNETLIFEYERALAEITSLKGQVLKLESTLLESQIRTPLKTTQEAQPELEYWKNYCNMLKEENIQLNMRMNALETAPTTSHQHRVNDLEQTVLTLRGLVSKLQAEQKSSSTQKRSDSRPGSGRSITEKNRPKQAETFRIEIANLKRTIQDKDLLLEKSKEMLKIAAEREEELLRENEFLRRRLDEIASAKGGFLSA